MIQFNYFAYMLGNVLKLIAKETSGTSFGGFRFSYEGVDIQRINYDENPQDLKFNSNCPFAETSPIKTFKDLKDFADCIKYTNNPLFSYFLDGTRRTYKIDDIRYGNKIYPIIAGQVAVGWAKRNLGNIVECSCQHDIVLCLPTAADYEGNSNRRTSKFEILRNEINDKLQGKASISHIIFYDPPANKDERLEDKGIAKIHEHMLKLEKDAVRQISAEKRLSDSVLLIKDGSLEYNKVSKSHPFGDSDIIKSNYKHIIGASKSFNPEIILSVNGLKNQRLIADLPPYHRTPVFKYQNLRNPDITFGVWYVRIREANSTSPFAGVLKIEKILISDEELNKGLESDEIDNITANLINERSPVCYGVDKRWENHLYPIYLTESYLKQKLYSTEYFTNLF